MSLKQLQMLSKGHEKYGGFYEINESDFKEGMILWKPEYKGKTYDQVMELIAKQPVTDEFDAMDKEELRAYLTERGASVPGNIKEDKLRELARGAKAAE